MAEKKASDSLVECPRTDINKKFSTKVKCHCDPSERFRAEFLDNPSQQHFLDVRPSLDVLDCLGLESLELSSNSIQPRVNFQVLL